jgi:5S rRNA maturation endonuclease (ribonuclease M5)
MRIPYRDFAEHIPTVVGSIVSINHDACPAGVDTRRRLYIKKTNDATLAYCHNCGGHAVRKNKGSCVRSADVVRNLLDNYDKQTKVVKDVTLPDDMVPAYDSSTPTTGTLWLHNRSITDRTIDTYNIGYSPSLGRIILPIYKEGKLLGWQGRQLDGAGPKYLNVSGVEKPLFNSREEMCGSSRTNNKFVVLVEDMLSAIRVSRAYENTVVDGVALLGTHSRDDLAQQLALYKYVYVWLDNDEAGRRAEPALIQRLKTTLNKSQRVFTYKVRAPEPKLLNNHEIKTHLGKYQWVQ